MIFGKQSVLIEDDLRKDENEGINISLRRCLSFLISCENYKGNRAMNGRNKGYLL